MKAWGNTGTGHSVLPSSGSLQPLISAAFPPEDSCGYQPFYNELWYLFSAVMLPIDAAKPSEKALWELLLLEAALTSGWISTRILEVSEEEPVSGAQLPSGMAPELHRAPSPSTELGQQGWAGESTLQSVLTSFCSFWGIFLYFTFFLFFFFFSHLFPVKKGTSGNALICLSF